MKKRPVRWLVLLLTVAVLVCLFPTSLPATTVAATNEGDLLQNGDFETGDAAGWTVPSWCAGGVTISEAAAKEGRYGVRLASSWANVQQTVNVQADTDYEISFWVLGYAVVYFKTAGGGSEVYTVWPSDYSDWTRVSYKVNSGNNTALYIEINCGEQTALVDDVQFAPVLDTYVTGGLGSVTEEDGVIGVAFKFDLKAKVQCTESNTFVSGTVAPVSTKGGYPLVRMGAVVTNQENLAEDLTLDSVNGNTCLDIRADKVFDVTMESVSYAVRVVNIPNAAKGAAVYARPYYVYRNGTADVVVYAPTVYEESYHTITDRVNLTDDAKWELYWNEEFGGNTLDSTKWTVSDGPSAAYYDTARPENVKVEDGNLVITARKEEYKGASFTKGGIRSDHKFSVLYGRVEIRAKLAWGKGVWPALWTMGDLYLERGDEDGWPYAGEIDILELVGETDVTEHKKWPWSTPTYEHTSNKYNEANRTATHNIHWGVDRDNHCEVGGLGRKGYESKYLFDVDNHPADEYHIYGVEWSYRDILFFIDDIQVGHIWWDDENIYSQNGDSPVYTERLRSYRQADGTTGTTAEDLDRAFSNPENPHWLILGIGLCEGWNANGCNTTDGTDLPASMYVDYVRVYKEKE